MAKLAQLHVQPSTPERRGAEVHRLHRPQPRYYAFLSYSHRDEALANWLYGQLEKFRVPHALAGRLTEHGVIPGRLTPIFRDEHELAAGDDLGAEIRDALASSQFLIVLCSPNAATSHWTNAEIEAFKRVRPDGCVLAAIAAGEPFASEIPGRESDECFPAALRQKYDRRGRPTGKRAEPLAADLRGSDEDRRIGFLKLVAGMLGVGLDELLRRATTRRQRRMALLAAASLGGMAVTSTLAVTAIQARDASREQRRHAESLVEFMLGDLKDKLEPIGKLDVLDEVGPKVLDYYKSQDTRELSDEGLTQRSRALTLMGQIADMEGNRNRALALYREAYAGTAEALRRSPDDPQSLYNHAQNVFYLADSARQRGDIRSAESGMQEYKRLAQRMVALDPENLKWRMEEQYVEMDLGILFYEQRQFREASGQFADGLRTIEAIAAITPEDRRTKEYVPEAIAWLADAQMSQGLLADAIGMRQRNIALLEQLFRQTGDVAYRQKLVPARRGLGNLYAMVGRTDDAIAQMSAAADQAKLLVSYEPANANWLEVEYNAQLNLAQVLLLKRRLDDASAQTKAGCDTVNRLLAKDRTEANRRAGLRDCLLLRAQIALARNLPADAVQSAQQAIAAAKTVRSSDAVKDRFYLAKAYRVSGDAFQALADAGSARSAWTAALAALSPGVAERPVEMSEHALILRRLGREAEARPLSSRLQQMGYSSAA